MKKYLLFILSTIVLNIANAQWSVPLINPDIESTTPLFEDGNRYRIDGYYFNLIDPTKIDIANSGLAPGEGRNGSQALKAVIQNTTNDGERGFDVNLFSERIDISNYGNGTYTFSFYAKSGTTAAQRPFWLLINAFDANSTNVTGSTVTRIDNGGTVNSAGMETDYVKQSVSIDLGDNLSGNGGNAAFIELIVQSSRFDNTYFFDDFELLAPQGDGFDVTFNVSDINGPLENASVTLNSIEYTTDATGAVTATGQAPGTFDYTVALAGYETVTSNVLVDFQNVTVDVTLEESLPFDVTFNVNDGVTAISGATVSLNGNEYITDETGAVTISNIFKGSYDYTVNAPNFEIFNGSIEVIDQAVIESVTLTELPMVPVSFNVTDGISLLESVAIDFNGMIYTTDATGVVSAGMQYIGTYSFTATLSGYEIVQGSTSISESIGEISIVLKETNSFSSRPNIPVLNGTIEDTTPMSSNQAGNRWDISEWYVSINAQDNSIFDNTNSGLAPWQGVNGSQAFKSTIANSTGGAADVTLNSFIDISQYGYGDYTLSFYVKASQAVAGRPFWLVLNAFDENDVNVNGATLTRVDNGGTVNFNGLESGYIKQSVTVTIAQNSAGGLDASKLRLTIQHASFDNTYLFDNFTLEGPEGNGYNVNFSVLEGTTPLENATVTMRGIDYTTDASGNVTVEGFGPGDYDYSVSLEGYVNETGSITVIDADVDQTVSMSLAPTYDVTFNVNDGTAAIANATITFDGNTYTTDGNGSVTISGILAETYAYSITATNFEDFSGSLEVIDQNVIEDVTMVESPKYDVTFVVTDGVNGLENALVNINGSDYTTDATGEVIVPGLYAGEYSYTVTLSGYNPGNGTVSVVDTNITETVSLVIIPTYTVTFNVSSNGTPISEATITFEGVAYTTDASGVATVSDLDAGTYNYTIVAEGYEDLTESINVTEDVTVTAVLTEIVVLNVSQEDFSIKIYPNPASDFLHIEYSGGKLNAVDIYSINGLKMDFQIIDTVNYKISIGNFAEGLYLIRAIDEQGNKFTERIHIRK